ncbi:MAG: carboxypeptidase M32 [Candidatus Nanoarchaeia archaeon]|nr:carboxypeptidase M32 [Candidatus Nanoarchaeia archaeon]
MNKDLELVNSYQKEIIILGEISALLGWDHQVYMPEQGDNSRSKQITLISALIHKKLNSEELFNAVKRLKNKKIGNKVMINRLYKSISKSRKLPSKFIEELSKEISLAHLAWKKAKNENKFEIFQPHLEKLVKLKQEEAKYIKLPGHIYNSLLDDYEEGMTVEKLKPIFKDLKEQLIILIKKIESSENYKKQKLPLNKKFDQSLQMELCKDVMKRIGLNEKFSRIDISEHPFSTQIGTNDVRITTHFQNDILSAFSSVIHESGHALYESNLPNKYEHTVLKEAPSLGLHESQSRFWENMIAKNKPFWIYYYPIFKNKFNLDNFEEWYKNINLVTPGKIRIYSDEVHYCLHIILRFEIELGLLEGTIKVKDLPKIWNQKMKEYFNVIPESDSVGMLQDVHWSNGSFGYFPTYAIGTIYAAQLYNKLKKDISSIENNIKKGDFSLISKWLSDNIHQYGSLYLADDLIKKVCGTGLNPNEYIKYLTEKYKEIYKF